ncbi:hypothetical protein LshimejAT787_1201600 [Lyophyllum shimeji]|uniref:Uncharacterized protein n=1 Tax=Lyophyllum shimeji TaxID=47721 RepID=A0A9P3PW30_LYOSH|nr:hypothetical protein LshimejAT787_1201600 [Lyophyllum shimeji]
MTAILQLHGTSRRCRSKTNDSSKDTPLVLSRLFPSPSSTLLPVVLQRLPQGALELPSSRHTTLKLNIACA